MESGYSQHDVLGGRKLSITLDDVDQLILSKSAENSNIKKNNPEAVNLGIAELALKEKALRDVYDDDVAEAHRMGMVHIHDLGYVTRVYCSAHSVEYIKKYGLDIIVGNLDSKSTPAKSPQVLNNHIHTFLAAIQSCYAGALGFPMLNTLFGPALLKETEMVEGIETLRNSKGEIIDKVQRRLKRATLESRLADGDIRKEDFEETGSVKVLNGYSRKELKQIAQNLVFGSSQSAFSRGGQTLFIDFNIDLDTPAHVVGVPALFLGAEYKRIQKNEKGEWQVIETAKDEPERYSGMMENKGHKDEKGKPILESSNINGDVIQPEDGSLWATYGHDLVRKAARNFAEALFEVSMEGDKYGNMFNFPKIDVHVGKDTFENEDNDKLLKKACDAVEKNDSVYFMYDRGDGMNVSQCCRLRERITDMNILKHPEKMRFCGFQNVSINLPQAAFRAEGVTVEDKLSNTLREIEKSMLIALKAHTNKRRYMQSLFTTEGSPMYIMGGLPSDDGEPYIDLAKSTYIIGIVGLNEAVQHICGKQMDENPEAYKVGLKIVSHMYDVKLEFAKRYGMKFVIEETPGESANRRLAKIDQIRFADDAEKVLKGSREADEVFYTNSSHIRADAEISGLDRTILQSKMNPMIEAGAITHIFSGEKSNRSAAAYDFVKSVFFNTQCSQVVFSGEHTVCLCCGNHIRGLKEHCPKCGNSDPIRISQKTRVVGYFSDPRSWNKSKRGELLARQSTHEFYSGEKSSTRDLEAELLESTIEPGKIRISVIGTKECPICEEAMRRINTAIKNEKYLTKEQLEKVEVIKYDVTTQDGRIMAAIYNAPLDTYPTVVVHSGDHFVSKGWEFPYNKPAIGLSSKDIGEMAASFVSTL
jgi:anaerobic ribonucleoside-triphosphate reductase